MHGYGKDDGTGIIIAIMAAPRLWALFRGRLPAAASQLPNVGERLRYASEYLGLVVFLILLAFEAGPMQVT